MIGRGGKERVTCGFIPLSDSAPLIVARELGFAAEEGIDLQLVRERSWSNIRDKLALGIFDAAHMLAPMPVAMALGLSAHPARVVAPMMLSMNGDMLGVSPAIAARLRSAAGRAYFDDARAAAAALRAAGTGRALRIGVPWLHSMHALLLDYWLGRCGFSLERDVALTVVPPPYMAGALSAGEIDMFCVGEPWGSVVVEENVGELFMSASAIWRFAPEKTLGVGPALAEGRPDVLDALLRAVYRSAEWASRPEHRGALSEMLSRSEWLECSAELVERAFSGSLIASPSGGVQSVPAALELFDKCATFPWRSQERWISTQLAVRYLPERGGCGEPEGVFRPDLYRRALAPIGAPMPAASAKIEGSLSNREQVAAISGHVDLGPDQFFDGVVFDPDA